MQVFNIVFLIYTFIHSTMFESHIILKSQYSDENVTFINVLRYTKRSI